MTMSRSHLGRSCRAVRKALRGGKGMTCRSHQPEESVWQAFSEKDDIRLPYIIRRALLFSDKTIHLDERIAFLTTHNLALPYTLQHFIMRCFAPAPKAMGFGKTAVCLDDHVFW